MVNCCCPESDNQQDRLSSKNAFQGEGRRLGSTDEATRLAMAEPPSSNVMARQDDEEIPKPTYNPDLTDAERAQIRADRAAAAEARLKKQGGGKKPKKTSAPPLQGPNSQPLMKWTAG